MEKEEKLDLDDLINDYRVENVDAFRTYLTGVWKDLAERSDNKFMGINKITFSKYYELPGIIFDRLFNVFEEKVTLDLEKVWQGLKGCQKVLDALYEVTRYV